MVVGFFKKFTGRLGGSEDIDVDEFLDTLGLESEDLFQEEANTWVKSYVLEDISDVSSINNDVNSGNIVLLNIEPLYKRNSIKLKQAVNEIKSNTHMHNGDIARLDEFKLLITPTGVKVSKTRR